ncbi:glycoside hydrolase family 3 C-terminal domain-containing protein [Anaerosporobacter sp.]|uniref:glycoside hydrolase family 3 C-terminal domain-containing protein n=1 Tax=Anaerosporobacter sp. TaxID=1872529 RepID=UPI00286ECDC3|nr:glycoside hydrolase family 3 C-terminal domain-containing protein [Anaerosporobacter sp.]
MHEYNNYKDSPLWDSSLPLEKRLDYLVENLTLEEKFHCLTTGCPAVPRLGITPFYLGGEAAHGIEARHDQAFSKGECIYTTAFPQPIGMSATWDTELLERIGESVGNEARVIYQREKNGGLCRWAPTIDMERDPRWGRTEEAYGEDPYLTGKMASSYIQGMRGKDPFYIRSGASLKHFYANNVETDRIKISSSIDPRNKHEYYLEPFRRAIIEGGAEAMMTAYNEINGIPCIVNDEVQNIVKDQWGLQGHVVCDGADMQQTVNDHKYFSSHAETIAYGLKAGIDCFTDEEEAVVTGAKEALERGLITIEDINRAIRHSFGSRIRFGIYDAFPKNPYANVPETFLCCDDHAALTLEAAKKSIVLLKNENSLLPLAKDTSENIAVIGPLSDVWYKDWYCGQPPYAITPLAGIKDTATNATLLTANGGNKVRLQYKDSYIGLDKKNGLILTDKEHASTFLHTDWGFGSTTLLELSTNLYVNIDDDTNQISATKKEAFGWFIKEAFDFKKQEDGSYYIDTWNDKHVYIDNNQAFTAKEDADYSTFTLDIVEDGILAAVEVAKKSDKAIVFLGSNPMINSKEEIDRTDIILPPYQEELIKAVYDANPNTILVLVTNYPYAINWAQENIPAIVYSSSGSQELGHGIASVLFGETSPAARLNMTWYTDVSCLPDINDYDIIQGKRTYQYFDGKVLYPFGFGLSYTTFAYRDLLVTQEDFTTITVSATITNTGNVASDEVVQLYVHQEGSRAVRPQKMLKGFERIFLQPNESKQIHFTVSTNELQYFDVVNNTMLLESGTYKFLLGSSSEDIRLQDTLYINSQPIGTRNMDKTIAFDRYDAYDNAYLHKGALGYTCALPKDATKAMLLTYNDVCFATSKNAIAINYHALTDTKLQIFFGTQLLLEENLCSNDGFIDTSFTFEESLPSLNMVDSLIFKIEGTCKLSYYRFINKKEV